MLLQLLYGRAFWGPPDCLQGRPAGRTMFTPCPFLRLFIDRWLGAGPGIFSGRLTEDQRQLMAGSPDIPAPAGKYVLAGAVTPDYLLRGLH